MLGNAGDSLSYHGGRPFSTKDRDNDIYVHSCATVHKGGWWFGVCTESMLNGFYHHGSYRGTYDGAFWRTWKGNNYSAKRSEMKTRPVKD